MLKPLPPLINDDQLLTSSCNLTCLSSLSLQVSHFYKEVTREGCIPCVLKFTISGLGVGLNIQLLRVSQTQCVTPLSLSPPGLEIDTILVVAVKKKMPAILLFENTFTFHYSSTSEKSKVLLNHCMQLSYISGNQNT
jgi:hypothetical protein